MLMDMYIPPRDSVSIQVEAPYIFDSKIVDVTGDQILDFIYLTGDKESPDSIYQMNLKLIVVDGVTNEVIEQDFKSNSGYDANLFIGEFSQDFVDDVLVSIQSGGSGAFGYYYMYSFKDKQSTQLFDYAQFNEEFKWVVRFLNHYRVEVTNQTLNQTFYLDISHKSEELLGRYYEVNGKVKPDMQGEVVALSGLYPVKISQVSNTFNLMSSQRVIGQVNVDTLGIINIYLKYKDHQFIPYEIVVGDYQFIE
ncbi:MAG: hypothetical protein ACRCST_09545 [Turicibacter sp.]